jgi:GntR family transcriptional regulator
MQGKGSMVLSKENEFLKEKYLLRIEEGMGTAVETAKRIGMKEDELVNLLHKLWKE